MRAFTLNEFELPPALRDDLPEPEAGDGQLVVRVTASAVNPVDSAIAGGMLRGMADYRFPVVLGRDFAGTVQRVGSGAGDYQEGDEVYGFISHVDPDVHNGSWTELAVVPADGFVDRKPAAVGWPEAGVAPLAALTAIPRASTRCWTWFPAVPRSSRPTPPCSRTVAAAPRYWERPATAPGAPT